jgi:TadE-like protein
MRPANDVGDGRGPMKPRRRAGTRGGAAVEFALVLPIFLAVLFAIVDYGWFFYQRFTLAAAIRDGVRYGVSFPMKSDPYGTAKARAIADLSLSGSPINPGNVTWGPATTYSGSSPDEFMTLQGTMPFTALVGFVKLPPSMSFQMSLMLEMQP